MQTFMHCSKGKERNHFSKRSHQQILTHYASLENDQSQIPLKHWDGSQSIFVIHSGSMTSQHLDGFMPLKHRVSDFLINSIQNTIVNSSPQLQNELDMPFACIFMINPLHHIQKLALLVHPISAATLNLFQTQI